METIVLASPNPEILDRLEQNLPSSITKSASIRKMTPDAGFLDFLRYEIPDLVILHTDGDPHSLVPLFTGLEEDPWLDSVGIIVVVPDVEEVIEVFQGFSIAYFLNEHELGRNLGRVVAILDEKREFLNYDGIIKKIVVT